jgi:hypothetical protein
VAQGGIGLQFEVKGQTYFLAFVSEERRWYLFAPNPQAVLRIPVYVDAPAAGKVLLTEEGKSSISH